MKGLCGRGGFVVDIAWKNGKLKAATVHSLRGNPGKVRYGSKVVDLKIPAGGSKQMGAEL